ncbi:methyltransferase domain-containing protein [Streptomyces sp. ACA25]|uniref:methyltransferase domain-containing protein n=1 Tax=Streptomyces sp. ACA25 TaxID=3022596 RepID=UPI0023079244|nr:methyltransferase domain-containing protein [Streptomyces sp. ACA25]MDB1089539.1 methyltransferase domain-containing protein [Streptomyces sp. ACA25]
MEVQRTEDLDREAAPLREQLVATLESAGVLTDPAWREAFRRVPRHVFVPAYYDPSGLRICPEEPRLRRTWLVGVHSDEALVTQRTSGEPTSSSSQPSLMATMLHELRVADGQQVLEIGAGTGYNAALLAHRLGDDAVTSIDLAPGLTAAARAHLAAAGHAPCVITGDGADGWAERAPYDRIIATCRIDAVPTAWLRQLTEDGIILAPLGHGLVRLHRTGEAQAGGPFLGTAYFMPLRTETSGRGRAVPVDADPAEARTTRLSATDSADDGFRFLVSIIEPDLEWSRDLSAGRERCGVRVRAADGSTARLDRENRVAEAGPRRVWARLEEAHQVYEAAGRPGPERFGLSVDGDRQRVWLDSPDGPSWPLPRSQGRPEEATSPP